MKNWKRLLALSLSGAMLAGALTASGGGSSTTPPPAESRDVEIDDGDVPEGGLPDIDDGNVPNGGLPDIEIGEDGVPLGDMPQTGDDTNLPLLLGAMVVSGSTLAGILIFGRKREDEGTN